MATGTLCLDESVNRYCKVFWCGLNNFEPFFYLSYCVVIQLVWFLKCIKSIYFGSVCTSNRNTDCLTLSGDWQLLNWGFWCYTCISLDFFEELTTLDKSIIIKCCRYLLCCSSFSPLLSLWPRKAPGTSRVSASPVEARASTQQVCGERCVETTEDGLNLIGKIDISCRSCAWRSLCMVFKSTQVHAEHQSPLLAPLRMSDCVLRLVLQITLTWFVIVFRCNSF